MADSLSISSNALVRLGASPISSFSENELAQRVNIIYDNTKENILSLFDWRFTVEKAQLAQSTTTPLTRWDYMYPLPSDRISDSVVAVYNDDDTSSVMTSGFEILSNNLMTNQSVIYIDYQTTKNESAWPAYFVELMIYAIAAEAAYMVTNSMSVSQEFRQIAYGTPSERGRGGLMGQAMTRNSQGAPNYKLSNFRLYNARFGSTGYFR